MAHQKIERGSDKAYGCESPAYDVLKKNGLLTTKYMREDVEAIFTGLDRVSNTTASENIKQRLKWCFYCFPCVYSAWHTELFVPAGHVGLLMDEKNQYLFAEPGMHNIKSLFTRSVGKPQPFTNTIVHGNRTIVTVEQGYLGYAMDNGQPVLLPPGIHVWTSESLFYKDKIPLNDHVIHIGPYTLLTVDEGYAAVTQNNGKQVVLPGGKCHLLIHKNWKFEKFMSLKIQTDDLEEIHATSADNIEMMVTSTVNWRISDVEVAAVMAAETMATSGRSGDVSADITKIRKDVLKQAIASLAGFIGGVNYSNSFSASSANQRGSASASTDNPLFDPTKMVGAVEHSNRVTRTYGVEVMSINIISATPLDLELTRALASGAVASAEALQSETAARGRARAIAIEAESEAARVIIAANGIADASIIQATGVAEAETLKADGAKQAADLLSTSEVAVELAKMDRSAAMLNGGEKYFFAQEPAMLSNVFTKKSI